MLFADLEDSLNAFIKRTETLKFPNDYARDWSWIYCYKFFYDNRQNDFNNEEFLELAALHLTAYLSSWGMYRGSSFLLKYSDYTVYKELIKLLLQKYSKDLYCDIPQWCVLKNVENEIDTYFKEVRNNYIVNDSNKRVSKTSIILTTKIMLGMFGCFTSLDRFVKKSLSVMNLSRTFNQTLYNELKDIINENSSLINKKQKDYEIIYGVKFPKFKILDMALWQKGYDIENLQTSK